MCTKHNALLLPLSLLWNTHLLKIMLRWENPLVAWHGCVRVRVCVCAFVCVWHSLEIVHTTISTSTSTSAKCMMWFNVDIYRCAIARVSVGVPLPVLLLYPIAVAVAVAECIIFTVCMHSAKEIARAILFKIQILSILTYIRNGGWECRFRTTYIHSCTRTHICVRHTFFLACCSCLCICCNMTTMTTTTATDNRQCVYIFHRIFWFLLPSPLPLPCAIQVENTSTHTYLSTFIE